MRTLAIQADYEAVVARTGLIRVESARQWGKMTAHEMVCHVSDSLEGALGQRMLSRSTGAARWGIVKWIALYAPLRWPQNMPTRPEVQQGVGGTPPNLFEADKERLLRLTAEFCAPGARLEGMAHPMFGPLSRTEWLRWAFLHADHHLRQFGL